MIVWAKSNGNWSDTTLWAFWNENTQQIEDYGQIPQSGDDVYLNGKTIVANANIDIGNGNIRNGYINYTATGGGSLTYSGTRTIIANIYCEYTSNTLTATENGYLTINGDIHAQQNSYYAVGLYNNSTGTCTINGNIIGLSNSYALYCYGRYTGYTRDIIINGNISNVNLVGAYNWLNKRNNLTINGNFTNVTITGFTLYLIVNGVLSSTSNIVGKECSAFEILLSNNANLIVDLCQFEQGVTFDNYQSFGIVSPIIIAGENAEWTYNGSGERVNPFVVKNINDEPDYPQETNVKKNVVYANGQMVGTYDINQFLPPESVVLKDYEYGDSDARKTGTMVQEVNVEVGCVTPEDVRKDVPLVGMGVVGTLVVPSVDDVREGVIFDNGSVGTLIVQGGGDRLRIADFGYYTRSTSITYIVDLTESDKSAFADCEEIVLRSLFPTLDLDNIPDKFYDDLFVQFLRYRLLVEYYRGTSINSKFTPSEPTAEIVNYANTKCEYWLNTANLFLQLWGEKYPNSVKKDRIIL